MTVAGFEFSLPVLLLGLAIGSTYGLLGAALTLIQRLSGVLNLAIGATGAFGASVVGYLVLHLHLHYWLAFPLGLAAAGLVAALTEVAAVRRLRRAPRLMSLVVTLGVASLLTSVGGALFAEVPTGSTFPSPPWMPSFTVGPLVVTPAFSAMLILSPIIVGGSALFVRFTRVGTALRATASNRRLAQSIGVPSGRMSLLAWALAGGFAGFTMILASPLQGLTGVDPSGPSLLLHALAAASIGRLRSMPAALGAGVAIGVIEQEVGWNQPPAGTTSVLLFVIVAIGLGVQRRERARAVLDEGWLAVQQAVSLRSQLLWPARLLSVIALISILLLPRVASSSQALSLTQVFAYTTIALGVLVVTGLTGHLSLGHIGFAALGALAAAKVADATNNYFLALLAAGAVGAAVAVIVGIPALRMRGLHYAVVTLAFGLAVHDWLLPQTWAIGTDLTIARPLVGTTSFDSGRAYYVWALVVVLLCLALVMGVRRSGLARTAVALRDNQDSARVFTVPALKRTCQVFGLSGFLAGVGGSVLAQGTGTVRPDTFDPSLSLLVVAAAVIGGLGYSIGPLLGVLFVIGVPQLVPLDAAVQAGTALGWLLLVMYVPSGLGRVAVHAAELLSERLGFVRTALRSSGEASAKANEISLSRTSGQGIRRTVVAGDDSGRLASPGGGTPVLTINGVSKQYGGIVAVDDVSLEVRSGEILGLIGPNGAGKTTLFEILSGFTRPDHGTVHLLGRDVSRSAPRSRSKAGMVRSFQDCRLFPTLTVQETVMVAHERTFPSTTRDLVVRGRDSRRRRSADELLEQLGLGDYARLRVGELSTGTRRIVDLACALALRPQVLLLDEPSAGIAQRESEALVDLLLAVRDQLDATLVVIEHDVPLLLALVDRLVAMETGRLIANGEPQSVINDPAVIGSYLGYDAVAVERSAPHRTAPAR